MPQDERDGLMYVISAGDVLELRDGQREQGRRLDALEDSLLDRDGREGLIRRVQRYEDQARVLWWLLTGNGAILLVLAVKALLEAIA